MKRLPIIPQIKEQINVNLKEITEDPKSGQYCVWMHNNRKEYFESKEKASKFLNQLSEMYMHFFKQVNLFYVKVINEVQPNIFKLDRRQVREYSKMVSDLNGQIAFTLGQYHGGSNHVFFQKLLYIMASIQDIIDLFNKVDGMPDSFKQLQSSKPAIHEPRRTIH